MSKELKQSEKWLDESLEREQKLLTQLATITAERDELKAQNEKLTERLIKALDLCCTVRGYQWGAGDTHADALNVLEAAWKDWEAYERSISIEEIVNE